MLTIFAICPAAAAYRIDFNGDGDRLSQNDDHIPATCMLGLRLAARNIFHCSLVDLRTVLPSGSELMYTFAGVMAYLARQKKSDMQMSSSTAVLQVVTVDELQLLTSQVKGFQRHTAEVANAMVEVLASWMISGSPNLIVYTSAACLLCDMTCCNIMLSDCLQDHKGMWV